MKYLLFLVIAALIYTSIVLGNESEKLVRVHVAVSRKHLEYIDKPQINQYKADCTYVKDTRWENFVFINQRKILTTVSFFSLLTDDYQQTIDLNSDTSLVFSTKVYDSIQFESPYHLLDFKNNKPDTIFISRIVQGCFGGSRERLRIIKKDEECRLSFRYIENRNKVAYFDTTIAASLFNKSFDELLESANAVFRKWSYAFDPCDTTRSSKNFWIHGSTLESRVYIRMGNKVQELIDDPDWKGYGSFIQGLKIPGNKHRVMKETGLVATSKLSK